MTTTAKRAQDDKQDEVSPTVVEVRKYLGVIVQYVLTAAIGIIAWQGHRVLNRMDDLQRQVFDQDKRLEVIERNRYTPADAMRDHANAQHEMNTKFEMLRTAIEKASIPPDYIMEDIREIKQDIKQIKDRQSVIFPGKSSDDK